MILSLADQINPLEEEIATLQYQLEEAQAKLNEIHEKVDKAEGPLSTIKSLAKDLTSMFKDDPNILKEIKNHVLSAFGIPDNSRVEKQEDSTLVADTEKKEETVKDVVESDMQEASKPTGYIADNTPVKNKKRLRKGKNDLKDVIDQKNEIVTSNEINGIVSSNEINEIVTSIIQNEKFTNLSQIERFFKEIEQKYGVKKSELIRRKFIATITKDTDSWNEYIKAYHTILPGTSLCPKNNPNEICYYVRPVENISDKGNRPTCEVIKGSDNTLMCITQPEPGGTYWLTDEPITPPNKIKTRIDTISKTKKPIDISAESLGVPF